MFAICITEMLCSPCVIYSWLCFISELYYDRGNHHEFTSLVRELARPGELSQTISYDFEFVQVEKPYESYTGTNVKLRLVCDVPVDRSVDLDWLFTMLPASKQFLPASFWAFYL